MMVAGDRVMLPAIGWPRRRIRLVVSASVTK